MSLSFKIPCPNPLCDDAEISVTIESLTRGWSGDYHTPPEPTEIVWKLDAPCQGCGLDEEAARRYYTEEILIEASQHEEDYEDDAAEHRYLSFGDDD